MEKTKLTSEEVAELRMAARNLNDIQAELDYAEECGIDCQYHRAASHEAAVRIGRLLQHFAPYPEQQPGG